MELESQFGGMEVLSGSAPPNPLSTPVRINYGRLEIQLRWNARPRGQRVDPDAFEAVTPDSPKRQI